LGGRHGTFCRERFRAGDDGDDRKYNADISGAITTAGTSTAYTLSSNSVFDTLVHMHLQMIAFVPHTTSSGTCTLNVDGLGAKPLRSAPSAELPSGTLVQGTPYVATYNNTDGAFYLQGFINNPYQIPVGGLMPYLGSSAPNSSFVLPYGQAISRTTYATLFALTGTAFGTGDGVTTFNVPDMRGRVPYGLDNMGGSASGRMTSLSGGIDGTTIGANGGSQNVTLGQANLPNVTLTVTANYTQFVFSAQQLASTFGNNEWGFNSQPSSNSSASIANGLTSSINGNVTQTAVKPLPPGIVVPYILRVI
jgi:microcystin-dependent protein